MVRRKNRYCLVEMKYADHRRLQRNISSQDVYESVRQAIQDCYGDYGIGVLKDSLMVKYLNPDTNMVIIRAQRDFHQMAHAAFIFVKKVKGYDCFLHTLYVGGTIRACQKFLISHHRHHLPILLRECKLKEKKEELERSLLTTCINMESASTTVDKERSISEMVGDG